jgi:small subunit ribosomal protein S9
MVKIINTSGKRKSAIARAVLRPGKGIIRVNNILLDVYEPKLSRMKVQEPLFVLENPVTDVDVDITVNGGGTNSQAEAARLALCKALVQSNKKLEKIFLSYDRQFLVADVRRKEAAKPNRHGAARAKRQKSYR